MPSKVNGSAKYGIDVQVPGMVYASLLHSPMEGVKVGSVNADDVKKIKGVTHVLSLPFGVAVVADTVEASRAGRMALKVNWDTSAAPAAPFDSEKAKEEYARKAKDPASEVKEAFKVGDADKALAGAKKTLEAAYWSEHTYHAQMEPMNAVAQVSPDGTSVEIWVGTQVQPLAAAVVANVLKTTPDKVKINLQLLGGGFGRRIWPDAPVQAAVISNIVKKPVKLMLTREDDIAAARPRPMTHHVMKAGLDDKNELVSWHHRIVSENVDAVAAPPRFAATGGRDYIGWVGMSQEFYKIPNLKADAIREQRGMRVHAWRGIGAGYNKFVSESFLDEVAQARGVDPLAYPSRTHQGPSARAGRHQGGGRDGELEEEAARTARLGIAFSDYHDTLTAGIAEVSVEQGDRQDQGPQLLDRGRSGPRHPARERPGAGRKRDRLRSLRRAVGRADDEGRRNPAVELQRLSCAADERHAGAAHQDHRHQQPAHRHGRGRHSDRGAGDRQCGCGTDRQAAPPPADVLRPGEEGAGLRPAFDRPHSRRVPPGTRRACFWAKPFCTPMASGGLREYLCRDTRSFPMDDKTQTELEAAVYRRLVEHLRTRADVQNIDMMNLAGFCRNCLSNWMKDAADAKGVPMTKDQSREIVYGEPFDQWKAKHQKEASPEQKAAFEKSSAAHKH